jgi:Lon protease-like protein
MGFLNQYRTTADIPPSFAVFPLPGALLLPRTDLPLNVFEPRYLDMVTDAMAGNRLIGMIQPEEDTGDRPVPALSRIGCVGRITSYAETPDDRILITLTGICRFEILRELPLERAYRVVQVDYSAFAEDLLRDHGASQVDRNALLRVFRDYLETKNMSADWDEVDGASNETLVNTLSLLAPYPPRDKQALLEAPDLKARADVLVALTEMNLARAAGRKPHSLQ